MSLFCSSCRVTCTRLLRNNVQSFPRKFFLKESPSCSVTSDSAFRCPADKTRWRLRTPIANISRKGFCTSSSKPEVKPLTVDSSKKGEESLSDDEGGGYELTEEERQVLKELEEEERRYHQSLSKKEDAFVWDGSFYHVKEDDLSKLKASVKEGHVTFENRQRIIQDVIEEMWNPLPPVEEEPVEPQYYPRGKTGVFDLGELVELLREEHADEIVAITIPPEFDYADHMVIATVSSDKHLVALATFVRKRYKMKDLKPTDRLPFYDKSVKQRGWIALDLGNIILHIFLQDVRDYYDLETLWTVGPLYDDLCNAKDSELVQLLNSIS